ncbi:MAG: hypothetical protein WC376_05245 [Candidatus Nanoarchaeia archaeon]|jgi:hypothetical protein
MADNNVKIGLGTSNYVISKKDFELINALQGYCQKKLGSNVELSSYQSPNFMDVSQYVIPKIGIEINPQSHNITKIQILSCGLEEVVGLEGFSELIQLDLRNNKLKILPLSLCDSLYKNKAEVYVHDNFIPLEDEHGTKSDGLFTTWILNEQYYTIDFEVFKKE